MVGAGAFALPIAIAVESGIRHDGPSALHVAVVGAGALGIVYGTLLRKAGVTVTFVVRSARVRDGGAFRLERVDGDQAKHTYEGPPRAVAIPLDADVVLVCVRVEHIDEELTSLLEPSSAPCVILTPLFPRDLAFLRSHLGARVVPAMASVVAYVNENGVVRFWLPHVAKTLVEETKPRQVEIDALVSSLSDAGIGAVVEMGVHETNPATTVSFLPVAMGLDAAGGVDALMEDGPLLDLVFHAVDEAVALGKTIGKAAAWTDILMKFAGSFTLRIGVALARRRAPEAIRYVEEHFGRKLHSQNVLMAERMLELAREKALPHAALEQLTAKLR